MSSKGFTSYKIRDQNGMNFITFATVGWVDIFTRVRYKNILIESLKYCQVNKGLVLNAFVIMTNHIHLIAHAKEGFQLSDILRDFKKYTSRSIVKSIQNGPESRVEWLLKLLKDFGENNYKNKYYQVWRNDNHPIELYSSTVIKQKLNYIHRNPVVAGIVEYPEDYIYSSARNYAGKEGVVDVEFV